MVQQRHIGRLRLAHSEVRISRHPEIVGRSNRPHTRVGLCDALKDFPGVVARAVVTDGQLKVRLILRERAADAVFDERSVVVSEQANRDARWIGHMWVCCTNEREVPRHECVTIA